MDDGLQPSEPQHKVQSLQKKKKKVQTGIRTFHSSHWFFWNVMLRLCRTNSMLVHLDIMVEILMLDTESKMHFSI
jgi:hypothetical protein